MDVRRGAMTSDHLLALVKEALMIADDLQMLDVAISLDQARVALEGPSTDHATLRALGADWLDDEASAQEQLARAHTIRNKAM